MTDWNGSSMLQTLGRAVPSVIVCSDASGTWGVAQCGQVNGYSGSGTTQGTVFLLRKEFLPLLLAAAVWGSEWRGHRVKFECDNSTVVAALERRSSRVPLLMQLLRALHYVSAYFSFT